MTNARWKQIQEEGAKAVSQEDIPGDIRLVAGVDVAYDEQLHIAVAAVVVWDLDTQTELESKVVAYSGEFQVYEPGYLSFRELPAVKEAIALLTVVPDLYIFDGVGVAHPRGFGLASHAGVALGIRSIGCAKTRFTGVHKEVPPTRGYREPLLHPDTGAVIGSVVRTQNGVKPLYVSVGHQVSLDTAISVILQCCVKYRQPEPIRAADHLCRVVLADRQREYWGD